MNRSDDKVAVIAGGLRGDTVLAEAALRLGREQDPRVDVPAGLARIDALAEAVAARLPRQAPTGDVLFTLNAVLFEEQGFGPAAPGSAADPRFSQLHEVLRRRSGDAVTLAILYLSVARRLGIPLQGVDFPGRFLAMLPGGAEPLVLDPTSGGLSLNREDLELLLVQVQGAQKASAATLRTALRPADNRRVLVRLLHNLKLAYLERDDTERALWAVNRVLELDPGHLPTVRDRARLLDLMDCHRAASIEYRRYLELVPAADDGAAIRRRLARIEDRSVTLH